MDAFRQNHRGGRRRAELAQRRQPRHSRQRDLKQHEVGTRRAHRDDEIGAGPGLRDDLESGADVHAIDVLDDRWRQSQQLPQARSEDHFVIGLGEGEIPKLEQDLGCINAIDFGESDRALVRLINLSADDPLKSTLREPSFARLRNLLEARGRELAGLRWRTGEGDPELY